MRETIRLEIPFRPGDKMDASELMEAIEKARVKAIQLFALEQDSLSFASHQTSIMMNSSCTHLIVEVEVTPLSYQPATIFLH